jgi:hypothetical protein
LTVFVCLTVAFLRRRSLFVFFFQISVRFIRFPMFDVSCIVFILFACPSFCSHSASRDDAAGPGDLLRFSRFFLCGVTRVVGRCSRGPVTSGSRTLLPAPRAGAFRVGPGSGLALPA